jgi:hypothetical protein
VSDCEDEVPATAAAPNDRLDELEAVVFVVAFVAVVAVLAVVAGVVTVAVVAVFPVAVLPVAVLDVAAMQPVSTSMLVTLTVPASLRARRAGCGRGRRGAGGRAVGMTAPCGRAWDQHRRGR